MQSSLPSAVSPQIDPPTPHANINITHFQWPYPRNLTRPPISLITSSELTRTRPHPRLPPAARDLGATPPAAPLQLTTAVNPLRVSNTTTLKYCSYIKVHGQSRPAPPTAPRPPARNSISTRPPRAVAFGLRLGASLFEDTPADTDISSSASSLPTLILIDRTTPDGLGSPLAARHSSHRNHVIAPYSPRPDISATAFLTVGCLSCTPRSNRGAISRRSPRSLRHNLTSCCLTHHLRDLPPDDSPTYLLSSHPHNPREAAPGDRDERIGHITNPPHRIPIRGSDHPLHVLRRKDPTR
ncbi:unnamed protein product [Gadus morhua 'NCC']